MAMGRGIFFLVSAISLSQPVDAPPDELAGKSSQQCEGDEPPAVFPHYPEVDNDRNGDVDIEIPREGEFPAILPQVTERQVDGDGNKYEPDEGQNVARSFHSRIVGFYGVFVNLHVGIFITTQTNEQGIQGMGQRIDQWSVTTSMWQYSIPFTGS